LAGYTEILLILNPADTVTKAHCDKLTAEGKVWGLSFCYATQLVPEGRTKPLGTADAVLQALEQNPDWQTARFMVCNSDNLYSVDVLQKVRECPHPNCFPNYNFDAMGFEFERYRMFGIVKTDEDGFLTALIEKPDEAQAQALKAANCGVSMNVFSFQGQDIMPYLQKVPLHPVRLEKELAGAVNLMAQENPKLIFTIPVSELVPDLTSKADISVVQAFLQATFGDF
jgi:glucose-1-phosphate thymidylyltransferase/glucose-1-phosphate adenylyltransferase